MDFGSRLAPLRAEGRILSRRLLALRLAARLNWGIPVAMIISAMDEVKPLLLAVVTQFETFLLVGTEW
jgi:hypothetical protein